MNLYLDASALVKRYLREPGTPEVQQAIADARSIATVIVSRVEVAAAFAKAARMQAVTRDEAGRMLGAFRDDWSDVFRLHVSTAVARRAERLAWEDDLRGYDALQLAAALIWQDGIGESVTFATFDVDLWKAAGRRGLTQFPEDLPDVLRTRRQR
ncbi:MAG: PIN domain-containing protein [Bacteroidetes bacterium]|jgi:predicted nucleic acid-binding protein|nr:PIN domain-containing protein [Bacteroidota bacterium]